MLAESKNTRGNIIEADDKPANQSNTNTNLLLNETSKQVFDDAPSTLNASRKRFLYNLASIGFLDLGEHPLIAQLNFQIQPSEIIGGAIGTLIGLTLGNVGYCTYKSFTKEGYDEIRDSFPSGKAMLVGGGIGMVAGAALASIVTRV